MAGLPHLIYSKCLDHLGLVAAMVDDLQIVSTINRLIPSDRQRIVDVGTAVKAMVLNGLGFISQPLYLTPDFFKNKAVDQLFGGQIEASHLNDDALGEALDAIYQYDPTQLYSQIACQAAKQLGLTVDCGHLDGTSIHVDGDYDVESKEGVIKLNQGYSRDHRPDLNQIVMNMIVSNDGGIPLLMSSASGNSDDKGNFRQIISDHISNLQGYYNTNIFVADSALYTSGTLSLFKEDHHFISRVPETIKAARQAIVDIDTTNLIPIDKNYSYIEMTSDYAGIKQRWIVIRSEHAKHRVKSSAVKRFEKKVSQERQLLEKSKSQLFSCQADAKLHLQQLGKQLKHTDHSKLSISTITGFKRRGRPPKNAQPDHVQYQITGDIEPITDILEAEIERKSYFILATNALDEQQYPPEHILKLYKNQHSVEKGFRFLKSPEFFTSSLNLKKPERIMALMMVMTICLLVYSALERQIRMNLQVHKKKIKSQTNKLTDTPTARWVFHVFSGIHIAYFDTGQRQMLNVNEQHQTIIDVMGITYEKYYCL